MLHFWFRSSDSGSVYPVSMGKRGRVDEQILATCNVVLVTSAFVRVYLSLL